MMQWTYAVAILNGCQQSSCFTIVDIFSHCKTTPNKILYMPACVLQKVVKPCTRAAGFTFNKVFKGSYKVTIFNSVADKRSKVSAMIASCCWRSGSCISAVGVLPVASLTIIGNGVSSFFHSGASGFNAFVCMGSFSTNAGSDFCSLGLFWPSTLFSKFSFVS